MNERTATSRFDRDPLTTVAMNEHFRGETSRTVTEASVHPFTLTGLLLFFMKLFKTSNVGTC